MVACHCLERWLGFFLFIFNSIFQDGSVPLSQELVRLIGSFETLLSIAQIILQSEKNKSQVEIALQMRTLSPVLLVKLAPVNYKPRKKNERQDRRQKEVAGI